MNINKSKLAPISLVVPYFNEEDEIEKTLKSLINQSSIPSQWILVDNGSTDNSREKAKTFLKPYSDIIDIRFFEESKKGKTFALELGAKSANQSLIAFCDSDTFYPPEYFEKALELLSGKGSSYVAAMAVTLHQPFSHPESQKYIGKILKNSKKDPYKTYSGGAGQVFRRTVYEKSGGYCGKIWDLMMADHEIMSRINRYGPSIYDRDFWCLTSSRRTIRSNVRWKFIDRLLYWTVPKKYLEWYFQNYLRKRMIARNMPISNLRNRDFFKPG